jgi:signal peptidase
MTTLDHPIAPAAPITVTAESPWRFFRKVFSATLVAALMFVAAVSVVLAVATHEVGVGDYQAFGHPVMSMLSGSMTPVISTGDLVVDDKVSASQAQDLHVGQIISFKIAANSPVVITHRIVRVEHLSTGVAYVTKGDANSSVDTPARPWTNVIGVVAYRVPKGGYVLRAVHRPVVIALFLLVVALSLSVGPMVRWARRGAVTTIPDEVVS